MFKTCFGFESYLKILPDDLRISLTRFRSGSHHLPISNARYNQIDDRNTCTLCSLDIGDEFHYLFVCPGLSTQRSKYLRPFYYTNPNACKFKHLMECTDRETLIKLSKFVKNIMYIFRN